MQFTLPALTFTALAMFKLTSAAVEYGVSTFTSGNLKGVSYNVAWIEGADACGWTFIANKGDNPCEKRFRLSNGYTYFLRGCGTDGFALYNGDGSYNAKASYNPDYTKYDCKNSDGQYKVEKIWDV